MLLVYSPHCLQYEDPGHPDSPNRVRRTVELLHKDFHQWLTPSPCTDIDLGRVHSREHLRAVQTGDFIDTDTSYFANTPELARLAAGGAILAAENAWAGRPAFSLMRPPGHHAERNRIMGFCYFNNLAIAVARWLADQPSLARVAILDFDCHHGNGTEDIFRGDSRVQFVSLHQSPCYPWSGLTSGGNCLNYALPPATAPAAYLEAFQDALGKIAGFQPQLLAVSAGFDAYKNDPITHMSLEIDTFHEIGARIAALCARPDRQPPLPCFAVLEGGYAGDVAHCVEAFVHGWEQH